MKDEGKIMEDRRIGREIEERIMEKGIELMVDKFRGGPLGISINDGELSIMDTRTRELVDEAIEESNACEPSGVGEGYMRKVIVLRALHILYSQYHWVDDRIFNGSI